MPDTPDSLELVLKEVEQVHQLQIQSLQGLTSRAGSVLSILIGALTASFTVGGAIAHPPLWALAAPGLLLLAGAVVSAWAFTGASVGIGPEATSLKALVHQSPAETQTDLIEFYEELIRDNRVAIDRRRRFLQLSLGLLIATVLTLVAAAVVLY